MRISVETTEDLVTFSVFTDSQDRKRNPKFGEIRQFYYKSITTPGFGEIHPDRLALVAILNTLPFCSQKLHICWPISERFLEATKIISRIMITSDDGYVPQIERIDMGKSSLSFSGGADSTAALAVMPPTTEPVFMLRSKSRKKSLYDSHAALESCRQLKNLGFNVHIIESDFEYLRDPVGFPTDLSVSTPALLLADSRNFNSVAFGTILESAFGTSGREFRNYSESSHFRLWNSLFQSVGLGYSLPLAGVSEVGSAILCKEIPIGRFHQSCIRGKWANPCNKCWKCFRKNTLMSALEGGPITEMSEKAIKNSREVRKHLIENIPIKHEGVLTFSLERAVGGGEIIDSLRDLVRVGSINTDWMQHWYPHSINLIDASYSEFTEKKLVKTLGVMEQRHINDLHEWSNIPDETREKKLETFVSLL